MWALGFWSDRQKYKTELKSSVHPYTRTQDTVQMYGRTDEFEILLKENGGN
jgi:hypothetical protein